jgi:pyruvate kinase
MTWPIKTKIIATVGPALESEERLRAALDAGASVFRFNLKHNTPQWHTTVAQKIKKICQEHDYHAALLFELKGPDIRIGTFEKGEILLKENELVWFSKQQLPHKKSVILDHPEILTALKPGQKFSIDHGSFIFEVVEVKKEAVVAKSLSEGVLQEQKGVNLADIEVPIPALVDKDMADIELGVKNDVDFIALSFVGSADDIVVLRAALEKHQAQAQVLAKIEKNKAIKNLSEILKTSDGLIIARSDLGMEVSTEEAPFLQKQVINKARHTAKPVIIATQMLTSMVTNPEPTRAEVSDVANTVLDGADALMLLEETAVGSHPIQAIKTMASIIKRSEKEVKPGLPDFETANLADEIDWSAFQMSEVIKNRSEKGVFLVLTETGDTVRRLARFRPQFPILAATQSEKIRDQLLLSWGVTPLLTKFGSNPEENCRKVAAWIRFKYDLKGDVPIITVWGWELGAPGQTSSVTVF